MGRSYLVGDDRDNNIKLDVFYSTDKFIRAAHEEEGLRLAAVEDIVAMKIDMGELVRMSDPSHNSSI